jgi:hypothetical protein
MPPVVLDEVILIGTHPASGLDVVVVGAADSEHSYDVWQAALPYVDVALSSAAARGITNPGAVLVDVKHDSVRVAKALRRIR